MAMRKDLAATGGAGVAGFAVGVAAGGGAADVAVAAAAVMNDGMHYQSYCRDYYYCCGDDMVKDDVSICSYSHWRPQT